MQRKKPQGQCLGHLKTSNRHIETLLLLVWCLLLCRRGGVAIKDWPDLLQPRLRGRLAFSDSPREFVGVGLKTLGLPFNCSPAQLEASGITLGQLKDRLRQLRQQVSHYPAAC